MTKIPLEFIADLPQVMQDADQVSERGEPHPLGILPHQGRHVLQMLRDGLHFFRGFPLVMSARNMCCISVQMAPSFFRLIQPKDASILSMVYL